MIVAAIVAALGTVRNFVYRGDLSVSSRGLWAGKDHVDD